MVGKFDQSNASLRDRVVLATKFTFNSEPGNPNAGGNGRKNIYRALEGSLQAACKLITSTFTGCTPGTP